MTAWLEKNEKGTFQFTGLVDPSDKTVVAPQATVDYGCNWFSISDGPAIVRTPEYDKFFSVSIFDMKHNVPAVLLNPDKPILIKRPGQRVPEGDFYVVELGTDQGLAFARMVVVDNMEEVRRLSKSIVMEGGKGVMNRNVQRFSAETEKKVDTVIKVLVSVVNPDDTFGKVSGDVSFLNLAAGVKQGQLGIPPDTVRYGLILTDENGKPLNGTDTYIVTVPANLVEDSGYFSVTVYGADNMLVNGEADAPLHAAEPKASVQGDRRIQQLFPDYRFVEQAYFKKTGIFPIMHAVAMRKDTTRKHPWLPRAVLNA